MPNEQQQGLYVIAAIIFLVVQGVCAAIGASYHLNMIDEVNRRLPEKERLPYHGFSFRWLQFFQERGFFWRFHRKLYPASHTRRSWYLFMALQFLFFGAFLWFALKVSLFE